MEDFFKEIKDNLEGRPEPPFEENAWKGMEKKLDGQPEKRRTAFAWWWLALPLLGLSLLSNMLVFNELQKSNAKIATLELRRDSVFQTNVVYRTDTIYQTRIVRETVREYLPSVFASSPLGRPSATYFGQMPPTASQSGSGSLQAGQPLSEGQMAPTNPALDSADAALALRDMELEGIKNLGLKRLRVRGSVPQVYAVTSPPPVHKPGFGQRVAESFKHTEVGLAGGLNLPVAKGLKRLTSLSGSLQIAVPISQRLRLWTDISIQNLRYESNRISDDIGVPYLESPLPGFNFINAEVLKKSRQLAFGLQYFWLKKGKSKPYIGLGYGLEDVLPHNISYDFRNEDTELERTETVDFLGDGPMPRFLMFRAGLEREIYKNWYWDMAASYRSNLKANDLHSPNVLNISTGLRYHF